MDFIIIWYIFSTERQLFKNLKMLSFYFKSWKQRFIFEKNVRQGAEESLSFLIYPLKKSCIYVTPHEYYKLHTSFKVPIPYTSLDELQRTAVELNWDFINIANNMTMLETNRH